MIAIGLMSGTSADGVDAALVSFEGFAPNLKWNVRAFVSCPYTDEVRQAVLRLYRPGEGDTRDICAANALLGEMFAEAAMAVMKEAGVGRKEVDIIASHGQTIWHQPENYSYAGRQVRGTLQIADPSRIAALTGITTAANFRTKDMALGGQGAPLVPYTDWVLCASPHEHRILLNIGGIANSTLLPAGCASDQVLAFDSGPGNALMDIAAADISNGRLRADMNGEMAAKGKPDTALLAKLMEMSYIRKTPPKSTGRELFSQEFYNSVRTNASGISGFDLLATLTAFTAESIVDAWRRWMLPHLDGPPAVYTCGGGARNPELIRMLSERIPEASVHRLEELGLDSDAKEAVSFALLGYLSIHGLPGNLPAVTEAALPAVLGEIAPGENFRRVILDGYEGGAG